MAFAYQAFDAGGRTVSGTLDAPTREAAGEQLQARSLFVTDLHETTEQAAAPGDKTRGPLLAGRAGSTRDLLMLAQQLTMMLRAGSRVVPALDAIESQIAKPAWRAVLRDIRDQVETGSPLSTAVAGYPNIFDDTWRAIISAGESTGQIVESFERLLIMTKQQQQIRVRLIGALAYPAALMVIAIGVLNVLMFFVLPRFDDLYTMLSTPLPKMTSVLLAISRWMMGNKIVVVLALLSLIFGPIMMARNPAVKRFVGVLLVRLPLFGKLARSLILARIFRVWGTAVRSNVPLLDSLELSRNITKNVLFRSLVNDIITDVSEGGTIGACLSASPLVPRTMASAIATGEQSGQLGESLLFLAGYLEEENAQSLASLTRLVEPAILVVLGVTVGIVAVSLFLPLFDLTAAA